MTEEIIEMTGQLGIPNHVAEYYKEELKTFAKLVAAKEREALKQIIRETPFSNWFQADLIEDIDKRGQA
tara:strand:+ start:931 stop:1137 length:207 start_codon:yes stop_codon:yes gene_type:complete